MAVVQGERVPGPLRLTARTPYVWSPEGNGDGDGDGAAGEDADDTAGDAAGDTAGDADDAAGDADDAETPPPPPPKLGPVATHETGRMFRCILRAGAPERVDEATDPDAVARDDSSARSSTQPAGWSHGRWTYGDEVHVAGSEDWTFTTSGGECDVDGVAIGEDVGPGVFTLEVRDVTPGWYGDLGRCNSVHVVLDVRPRPETEGHDGDGAAGE